MVTNADVKSSKLDALLLAYRKILDEMATATLATDEKIAELTAKRQLLAAPFEKKLAELDPKIAKEIEKIGETYTAPNLRMKASYRNGFSKAHWDGKGLDALEADNPKVWKVIKVYRSTTEVDSSFKVERM